MIVSHAPAYQAGIRMCRQRRPSHKVIVVIIQARLEQTNKANKEYTEAAHHCRYIVHVDTDVLRRRNVRGIGRARDGTCIDRRNFSSHLDGSSL